MISKDNYDVISSGEIKLMMVVVVVVVVGALVLPGDVFVSSMVVMVMSARGNNYMHIAPVGC